VCLAACPGDEAAEHAGGGGLAGPVRAQETEDLAFGDMEGYMVYGGCAPESLGQVLGINQSRLPLCELRIVPQVF
jgi:hypothetical protein